MAWPVLGDAGNAAGPPPARLSFNRDIRPLLSDSCFHCHGPDASKRQADLRLDDRRVAVEKSEVIVPGKAADSPLFQRITSTDPAEMMPPPNSHKPRLSAEAVARIRRWIDEGAPFEPHWAYVKPARSELPSSLDARWTQSPIDRFLAAGWAREGLRPAAEADRHTLIRRLTFDLWGLPPKAAEVDTFVRDDSPQAYESLVDRLLAAPQFGERMAMYWLDVVRYADSGGYHSDNDRTVWLYRDYVINAFNENKPFDQFTVEQLAGDLLAQPTRWQKIASGYNRLLQTTEEGGAQAQEYTAKYAADRVRNTATAWLGVTFGCAECHDHKFDPLSTRDFYSMEAFFADVDEQPIRRQQETPLPDEQQTAELARLDVQIAALLNEPPSRMKQLEAAQAAWEKKLKALPANERDALPQAVRETLAEAADRRSYQHLRDFRAYFHSVAPETADIRAKLVPLENRKAELEDQAPYSLITRAAPPRTVRVLARGNWQDESGEIVAPAVPAAVGKVTAVGARPTRLDLARWVTSADNPLVARVFVNRLWKLFFGQGIARTLNDLGSQGAPPTHPELLDWLAVEFRESGWNVKRLVRLLVTSRAYRLTSQAGRELLQRDPANVWLARQGRFRFDAETVRDSALAVSGLLCDKIGGPSVRPYQPDGYWDFLNFPKRTWREDRGANRYRRGLYTHWQRTFLHPSLLAFDAPTREESCPERARSNTPLQSLDLLNDPSYVEAARALAARILREGGSHPAERLKFALREMLQRLPADDETQLLASLYEKHLQQYRADPAAAQAVAGVGQSTAGRDLPAAELAAWTSVSRALLNLHEAITRY